jgi:hypothetical protein
MRGSGEMLGKGYDGGMDLIWYTVLFALLALGFLLTLLTLPGNWVMILATCIYARLTGWRFLGWRTVLVLVGMGLIGEIVDLLAGSAAAKRAGGSRRGAVGAFIGAIVGGLVCAGAIPIIGAIVGVILGAGVGALLFELSGGKPLLEAAGVGMGAARGKFVGMLVKITMACAIFLIGVFGGFPNRRRW